MADLDLVGHRVHGRHGVAAGRPRFDEMELGNGAVAVVTGAASGIGTR